MSSGTYNTKCPLHGSISVTSLDHALLAHKLFLHPAVCISDHHCGHEGTFTTSGCFFFFFWWRELFPGWEQLKNVSPTVQISSTLPSFLWQAFPGICCLTISYHSMWAAVRSLGTGLSQDIPHSHEPSVVAGQWLTHTIDVQWMNEWAWHLLT